MTQTYIFVPPVCFSDFVFIFLSSGFKIPFPSAQCRGVRGEYTELTIANSPLENEPLDDCAKIIVIARLIRSKYG